MKKRYCLLDFTLVINPHFSNPKKEREREREKNRIYKTEKPKGKETMEGMCVFFVALNCWRHTCGG